MSRKWSLIWQGMGIVCLVTGFTLWMVSPARAQCGDNPPKSSCITCHDKEDPVYKEGEWHAIHAKKDICTSCHGGNCASMDKTLAHESLVANPLDDIYTSCHSCHPDDYATRAAPFAVVLAVTPGSIATPTAAPTSQVVEHPMVILPVSAPASGPGQPWILLLDAMMFTCLISLAVIGLLFYLRKHHKSYHLGEL